MKFLALKKRKMFLFHFFSKKTPQILFQDSMTIFQRIFLKVLHISVGQKIKILETRPDFLIFSAKLHNRL